LSEKESSHNAEIVSGSPKPDLEEIADQIEAEWYAHPRPSPYPVLCKDACYDDNGCEIPGGVPRGSEGG
jgi:hypothetical protein